MQRVQIAQSAVLPHRHHPVPADGKVVITGAFGPWSLTFDVNGNACERFSQAATIVHIQGLHSIHGLKRLLPWQLDAPDAGGQEKSTSREAENSSSLNVSSLLNVDELKGSQSSSSKITGSNVLARAAVLMGKDSPIRAWASSSSYSGIPVCRHAPFDHWIPHQNLSPSQKHRPLPKAVRLHPGSRNLTVHHFHVR
eukprot:755815-Hanusia_phi.AAC.3